MDRRLVVALGLLAGLCFALGASAAPKKGGTTKQAPKKIVVPKDKLKAVEFMVGSGTAAVAHKKYGFSSLCYKAKMAAQHKAKAAAEGMCKAKGNPGGGKFQDITTKKSTNGDFRKCLVNAKYRVRCVLNK